MNFDNLKKMLSIIREHLSFMIQYVIYASVIFTIIAYQDHTLSMYDLSMSILIFSLVVYLRLTTEKQKKVVDIIVIITGKNLYDEITGTYSDVLLLEYVIFAILILRLFCKYERPD